jgi:SAM-dependent methyltransferase
MHIQAGSEKIDARFAAVAKSRTFRNIVHSLGLDKKAVLDVGCSYGEHLAHFGPGSTGVTINPKEAEEGRRRGLDMVLGNIEEMTDIKKKYDVIYCNNLLEHLYSPHAFLYRIRTILAPGGLLVLGVPVLPFPQWLTRIRKFRGALAGAHINFFDSGTLALTVERAGWQIREIRGFRLPFRAVDLLVTFLYPHLYVLAEPDPAFSYDEKRLHELAGYTHYNPRPS